LEHEGRERRRNMIILSKARFSKMRETLLSLNWKGAAAKSEMDRQIRKGMDGPLNFKGCTFRDFQEKKRPAQRKKKRS